MWPRSSKTAIALRASRSRRPIVLSRRFVHRGIDADQTTLFVNLGVALRFTCPAAVQTVLQARAFELLGMDPNQDAYTGCQ